MSVRGLSASDGTARRAGAKRVLRVCFVTGTRAEFGLMRTTLDAIGAERGLRLQIVATGMHLDKAHGDGLGAIGAAGYRVDGVVDWPAGSGTDAAGLAAHTGQAIAGLAGEFERLKSDVVLVVGDRVEAFAGAAAGAISRRMVAHVHGGDRALGQLDDSLRHSITKLAHVHFAATRESARRLIRLGEDAWRVHMVGAPGVDGLVAQADVRGAGELVKGLEPHGYALVVLHPAGGDAREEEKRARLVSEALVQSPWRRVVVVSPNNDPGCSGILRAWKKLERGRFTVFSDVERGRFLRLMRDAGVMVGNSSSGIIEAASFGTPVVDIGPRQEGRLAGGNVRRVGYERGEIGGLLQILWNRGRPRRWRGGNVYGQDGAGARIAAVLSDLGPAEKLMRKLISY